MKPRLWRLHDFGDDHVRVQSLDGAKGLGRAARHAADLQAGTMVDPPGGGVPHQRVPIHQQNPPAPPRLFSLRFLGHL